MLELTPVLVLTIIFTFVYSIVKLVSTRKERMELLARGADPNLFNEKHQEKFTSMKYGLLLIGLALGIFLGDILSSSGAMEEESAYFSMIFLFGGASLVLSYFLGKNLEKKKD